MTLVRELQLHPWHTDVTLLVSNYCISPQDVVCYSISMHDSIGFMFNNHPCESEGIARGIGTCRAVWVPGQDLATPHLMCNCGKCILSLHCTLYVSLCTHMLYAGDYVSLHPVLVIWVCMIRNNPGNARVCPGLQVPMQDKAWSL